MTQTRDTRGQEECPAPILEANKAMNKTAVGDNLTARATDPGSVKDFKEFREATGNAPMASGEQHGDFTFVVEKRG